MFLNWLLSRIDKTYIKLCGRPYGPIINIVLTRTRVRATVDKKNTVGLKSRLWFSYRLDKTHEYKLRGATEHKPACTNHV